MTGSADEIIAGTPSLPTSLLAFSPEEDTPRRVLRLPQFIVGIENCAPSLMPDGQRAVTVFVRV